MFMVLLSDLIHLLLYVLLFNGNFYHFFGFILYKDVANKQGPAIYSFYWGLGVFFYKCFVAFDSYFKVSTMNLSNFFDISIFLGSTINKPCLILF